MAQGDQRPRHSRNTSRILRFGNSSGSQLDENDRRNTRTTNDDATVLFIKRVLCAQTAHAGTQNDAIDARPLDELLPPLTSSNEVDIQLYAIIAVILHQFVQSWYNRITLDQDFVSEITHIIAHCTRGIEQRFRQTDLEELLLDELPALALAHIDALIVAQNACANDRPSSDVQMVYHSINPNKALTPLPDSPSATVEQLDNEIAWSQLLVSRLLPLVLPPEDLQNPCLHVLVSDIFSEMIVHNALCVKASEPWIIWEGVTKLIYSLRPELVPQLPTDDAPSPINRLEQFGLLSSGGVSRLDDPQHVKRGRLDIIAQTFWTSLQFVWMAWILLRALVTALMHASSIPARSTRFDKIEMLEKTHVTAIEIESQVNPRDDGFERQEKRPVVTMKIWPCISRLSLMEQRMPWLTGCLSLIQWLALHGPGRLCRTNSALDRLFASQICEKLLNPALLPRFLQAIRGALFPDNALAPARQTPTSAETEEIKRVCAKAIIDAIPKPFGVRYFATEDQNLARQDVERSLDWFADPYINKHLIISAVELIVVRLFPELGEDRVED